MCFFALILGILDFAEVGAYNNKKCIDEIAGRALARSVFPG